MKCVICAASLTKEKLASAGLEENVAVFAAVYPNPSKDFATIILKTHRRPL